MITLIAVVIAIVAVTLLLLPYLDRGLSERVPSFDDPVTNDLKEERDALFEAIRELDLREDLGEERRQQLRARYEAKAAGVLKRIDDRRNSGEQEGKPTRRRRRAPAGLLMTLVLIVPSLFLVGEYVLPRVIGGTVTTFQAQDIATGRRLQRLQREVRRNPTRENLLELADNYWQQGVMDPAMAVTAASQATMQADAAAARLRAVELYLRVEQEFPPLPVEGLQRLGLQVLNERGDLAAGVARFEQARELDPDDLDTLYMLGELYYAQGRMEDAIAAWEAFLVAPNGGVESAAVLPRLEAARTLAPLMEQVAEERNGETLLALADAYWELEDRGSAAQLYSEAVTDFGMEAPRAVQRIGITLFMASRAEEAVLVLERARELEPDNLETLLFLGNSYFTLGEDERAIGVWRRYVEVAGGPEQAGRVPQLIERAQARLSGEPLSPAQAGQPSAFEPLRAQAAADSSGATLFQANCATCHGTAGEGGMGPRLAGNDRAADPDLVTRTVRNGRGMMPGFGGLLSEGELERLVDYVVTMASR